jgi:hypothetical protein
LNLNWNGVSTALYDAFGPEYSTTIYSPTNQYEVLLEMLPQYQEHTDGLKMIYLKSDSGQVVPLSAVAKLVENAGPQSIPHSGQLPSVTISFSLRPGTSLGQATDEIDEAAKANLSATITGAFQGTAKVFQDSMQNMGILLVVAIAVVYIVLGMLYESYVHPLTILSGLPSAGFGALLTLLLFKIDLSIYSFVGLIMLIGIVKKNAIMQVNFALDAHHDDHHGGAAGRPAHRTGLRRGRRGAPAAGHGGGGRPGLFAVDDSVFDSGGLYLYGGNRGTVECVEIPQGLGSRDAGGRLTHEHLSNLHREAHRHQPADGGYRAVRGRRLPRAAGERSSQRGLAYAAGDRQFARRQSRNHGRGRGHSAREPVLHHRRDEFHVFDEFARQYPDHAGIRP